MRAYLLPEPDAAPRFADIPVPEPAPGEVLVRLTASSVNPHDAMVASGAAARYMEYRYPVVLGSDLAGTVVALGESIDDLSLGDRVFGLVRELVAARGSFAELVALPREWLAPIPDGVDDASAGAFGLAALTALRCVEAIRAGAGDVVLVNGATGGVGSYAVQLLTARGAFVIATARPGEEAEHVRGLGAHAVVDWTAGDLAAHVRAEQVGGISALVDLVHRDREALSALSSTVLAPGGRVASTGHAADVDGLPGVRGTNVRASADRAALATLAELAGAGRLRAPITRTFGLPDVEGAFARLRDGALGKISVRV